MKQVAFGSLLGLTVYAVVAALIGLSGVEGSIAISATYVANTFVLVQVLFLPLFLWGMRSAYLGGLGIGAFGVFAHIMAALGSFGPDLPGQAFVMIGFGIVVNLVLIGSSWMAWRE